MIIDLHSHLLPNCDDGASSINDSLDLARQAVSEGISHLVVTPHHYNNQYVNHANEVKIATKELQRILDEEGIKLKIYPGQEIRITENLLDLFLNGDLLSLDSSGRYFLIEFPTASIPEYSERVLSQLIFRGVTPIIAHPERNHIFAKNLNFFADFINMGCRGQVTTSSMAGAFGEVIQKQACEMVERNLVHIIASDAHNTAWRPFNYIAAFEFLEERFSLEKVNYFKQNAISVLNGEDIILKDVIYKKTKRKRWGCFSRHFTK